MLLAALQSASDDAGDVATPLLEQTDASCKSVQILAIAVGTGHALMEQESFLITNLPVSALFTAVGLTAVDLVETIGPLPLGVPSMFCSHTC